MCVYGMCVCVVCVCACVSAHMCKQCDASMCVCHYDVVLYIIQSCMTIVQLVQSKHLIATYVIGKGKNACQKILIPAQVDHNNLKVIP